MFPTSSGNDDFAVEFGGEFGAAKGQLFSTILLTFNGQQVPVWFMVILNIQVQL